MPKNHLRELENEQTQRESANFVATFSLEIRDASEVEIVIVPPTR
jgi:hypothetical protein